MKASLRPTSPRARSLAVIPFLLALTIGIATAEDFPNPPGWRWALAPVAADFWSMSNEEVLAINNQAEGGAYSVTFGVDPERITEYRAIVFDDQGRRHEAGYNSAVGNDKMGMVSFHFESLDTEITHVGLEVLPPEGRAAASRSAMVRSRELGIPIMAYPTLGESYDFTLTAVDGRTVTAATHRGKVLLLEYWATWCKPCMKGLPQIQDLAASVPADRFSVVGINFDPSADKLRSTLAEMKIDWPNVHIEPGPEVIDLWFEAAGMRSIPRYIVLDPDGTVRLDTNDTAQAVQTVRELLAVD